MSGIRAPTTVAPAAGWGTGGPKSGIHSGCAELTRQVDTLGHRRPAERNEGDDVDGADARMDATVRPQVDSRERYLEQPEQCFGDHSRIADHGEDRAIVRGVCGVVEQHQPGDPLQGSRELGHDRRPLPLADVGN
jgi:hypothetical protein